MWRPFVDEIQLAKDPHGVYRVGGTRVTLDLVVRAFNRGATAEEIVQKYDTLRLPDVYQVIGYYLKHADELADYFETRAHEEETLLSSHPQWSPKGLRVPDTEVFYRRAYRPVQWLGRAVLHIRLIPDPLPPACCGARPDSTSVRDS